MKIVTSGCSFTEAEDSWANYLKEKYKDQHDIINVAEGGGGNEMNIRNITRAIIENNPDFAILQISGVSRYELITDEVISNWTSETHNVAVQAKETYTWLKSTGTFEWLEDAEPRIGAPLKNYRKYCYSEVYQLLKTLYLFKNFQTLCENMNVKYKIFLWKREFKKHIEGKLLNENEELKFWFDSIDWKTWWLYDHKGGRPGYPGCIEKGGIAEWGIDNGYAGVLSDDHTNTPPQGWIMKEGTKRMLGHPSSECHQAFAEQVVRRWITDAS